MHGYDLRKRLREDFGPLANLSFGSLYPALARLEASEAVRTLTSDAWAEPVLLPLTGSLGGERAAIVARRATAKAAAALGSRSTRARKVYEITERGEAFFEQLLESTDGAGEDGRSFVLKLAFARHLSPPARLRLLERRHLQLADRLRHAERTLSSSARPLDRYERSIAEHARETLVAELTWVERLLDAERSFAHDALAHPERHWTEEPAPAQPGHGRTTDSAVILDVALNSAATTPGRKPES